MERANFFNDQLVIDEDLNYVTSSLGREITKRIQGMLGNSGGFNEANLLPYVRAKAGVLGSPGESSINKNLKIVQGIDNTQLIMYPGSAIDTNGELIYIDTTKTINYGVNTLNYSWLGSSGTNYVKLSYLDIVNSGSIKTDDIGQAYPTRYNSSWYLKVDSTVPSGSELLLATFTGDTQGRINGPITDSRLYARFYTFADAVGLDPYNTPVPIHKNVGDHIRATGSGVPSPNNPHGLNYSDLGGENNLLSISHATNMHVSCIIPIIRNTSAFDSYKGTVINPTNGAYVTFQPPSNAFMIVDGKVVTGSINNLYASNAFSIAGDGVYYAVVDSNGQTSWKDSHTFTIDDAFTATVGSSLIESSGHAHKFYDNNEFLVLGIADISDNGDDIADWTDTRIFYGTHPIDIGADYKEQVLDPNSSEGSLKRESTLVTSLSRIRNQLGRAINGSPTSWKTSVFPLTDGASSDADNYHTHPLLTTKQSIFLPAANLTFPSASVLYPITWVKTTDLYSYTIDDLNLISSGTSSVNFTLPAGIYFIDASIELNTSINNGIPFTNTFHLRSTNKASIDSTTVTSQLNSSNNILTLRLSTTLNIPIGLLQETIWFEYFHDGDVTAASINSSNYSYGRLSIVRLRKYNTSF